MGTELCSGRLISLAEPDQDAAERIVAPVQTRFIGPGPVDQCPGGRCVEGRTCRWLTCCLLAQCEEPD